MMPLYQDMVESCLPTVSAMTTRATQIQYCPIAKALEDFTLSGDVVWFSMSRVEVENPTGKCKSVPLEILQQLLHV